MPGLKDMNGFAVRDTPELAKSSLDISGFKECNHRGKWDLILSPVQNGYETPSKV